MPIKIKTDLDFGQSIYVKNDPEQLEHHLVGVKIVPPNQLIFILDYLGGQFEFFDFQCSMEKDPSKLLGIDEED